MMKEVRDAMANILDNTSLGMFWERYRQLSVRQLEALMYHI